MLSTSSWIDKRRLSPYLRSGGRRNHWFVATASMRRLNSVITLCLLIGGLTFAQVWLQSASAADALQTVVILQAMRQSAAPTSVEPPLPPAEQPGGDPTPPPPTGGASGPGGEFGLTLSGISLPPMLYATSAPGWCGITAREVQSCAESGGRSPALIADYIRQQQMGLTMDCCQAIDSAQKLFGSASCSVVDERVRVQLACAPNEQ